jgi:hypothetical protein
MKRKFDERSDECYKISNFEIPEFYVSFPYCTFTGIPTETESYCKFKNQLHSIKNYTYEMEIRDGYHVTTGLNIHTVKFGTMEQCDANCTHGVDYTLDVEYADSKSNWMLRDNSHIMCPNKIPSRMTIGELWVRYVQCNGSVAKSSSFEPAILMPLN